MLDYDSAIESIAALQARDTDAINPLCRTQLLAYGNQVERAIVFLHGFTNCPQQFAGLAEIFYRMGWNVLNPRLPHHGLADRLTGDLARMRADELVSFTDDLLEVASGLGERVCLVGLSLGGTLALRAAQRHPELERAVAVAPFMAPHGVPRLIVPVLAAGAPRLPNRFFWGDSSKKAEIPGPKHAYPRIASRAVGEVLRISADIQADARRPDARPQAKSVLLVTNDVDEAVNNAVPCAIVKRWQANGARNVKTYEFPASMNLVHDMVDKEQPGQRTRQIYPMLVDLITER